MSYWVVELLASSRECNSCNFEYCERMVVELENIPFKTLYGWMVAINRSSFSNFLEYMDLCYSLPKGCFSCNFRAYLGFASLRFLIRSI
jgi:hypothetical protein